MKKLSSYFLQGILFLAPIAITIYVIYFVFVFFDDLLRKLLTNVIGIELPGLGILIMLIFLTVLGYIGQTVIARPFKSFFKKMIHTVPILELIYSAIKDFFSAFVGQEKKFNKPVYFKVNPADNANRIGFVTNQNLSMLGEEELVAVYVPFSYTFTGETYLVRKSVLVPIEATASEVMKFLVAGGVADMNTLKE